ncbi:MAG: nickel-dependent lactate racemase [Candidatus Methanoperedens sp.]|nr:nickel-dependent lactate racemase [Candidatus Methanoperedens sp.]
MKKDVLYYLPFGKTKVSIDIPSKYNVKLIKPGNSESARDETKEIKRALKTPIHSRRLVEIAREGRKAVIIVSDTTRPTPTRKLLPPLISELKAGGIEDVTIVFGLGIHRKQTEDEKKAILGELYGKVNAIEHNVNDCVNLGTTKRGTPVEIFKHVADADIVICTGAIEFHYYAGYSGGAKSILPAVSSKRSIDANHALMLDLNSSAGRLDSPVRDDLEEAARMLGIDFILNVVLNDRKEIIFAVAGDYIEAHRKGVAFLDKLSRIEVEPSDIAIVSPGGWPKDIDIFQSHKALPHVKNAVKDGGSIILVAECREGYGNKVFEEWLEYDRNEVIERFKSGFVMGGHKAALIAALSKRIDLYLVSSLPDEMVRRAYFIPATLKGALEAVLAKHGEKAKIIVMPYGGSTLAFQDVEIE